MAVKLKKTVHYIPDSIWESIIRLHGAIDPDTGHLSCHHNPLGLGQIEVSGVNLPVLVVSDCLVLVLGEENVKVLLKVARPAAVEELGPESTSIGSASASTYHLALVLSLLREFKAQVKIYTVRASREGFEEEVVLLHVREAENMAWGALILKCPDLEGGREGDTFYL